MAHVLVLLATETSSTTHLFGASVLSFIRSLFVSLSVFTVIALVLSVVLRIVFDRYAYFGILVISRDIDIVCIVAFAVWHNFQVN